MGTKYFQLTAKDRERIDHFLRNGWTVTEVARKIGVHKSTISRELARNARRLTEAEVRQSLEYAAIWVDWGYEEEFRRLEQQALHVEWNALDAQRTKRLRTHVANQARRRKRPETLAWVIKKLKEEHWTPEQIAGRSKIEGPEPVSHEFVYRLIYEQKKQGKTLHHLLKRFRKRKQRFNSRSYPSGPIIPNRRGIEERPKCVEKRLRLGDLEGDLIQGYRHSGFVLSVVDRKSKWIVLRKLPNKRKDVVRVELERAVRAFKCAQTLTLDNGSEFCEHEALTRRTGVPVYFAHPYCSTDKATIENSNALVRYFLPKRTCFKGLTQERLNQIQKLLNSRPRKCLGYLTPEEAHFRSSKDLPPSVALVS